MSTPTKCDCLNFCGDDPWLKDGRAVKCERYDELHRHDSVERDAARFRWACDNPAWLLEEAQRCAFPGQTPVQFYRALADEIDRRRAAAQHQPTAA